MTNCHGYVESCALSEDRSDAVAGGRAILRSDDVKRSLHSSSSSSRRRAHLGGESSTEWWIGDRGHTNCSSRTGDVRSTAWRSRIDVRDLCYDSVLAIT